KLFSKFILDGKFREIYNNRYEVDSVMGTGYGRLKIPFAQEMISELHCIALAAHSINPNVRMVIESYRNFHFIYAASQAIRMQR
ncbi:MAG: hypothetical protein AAB267_03800, partial [Candidatus Desantisbacteria bacterium]